jgi:hypothetical protein
MPTVVAAVVRRKRAFLGVAAARIVGDVGGGGDVTGRRGSSVAAP